MNATSKVLLFSIFAIFSAQAMEDLSSGKLTKIKPSSIFSTNEVGKVDLFHDNEGYHVVQDDEVYSVNKHSIDPLLRSLKHKQLKKFQKCGYIQVKKNQDHEFSLVSKVRGNGGGPVTGVAAYWTTKAAGYVAFAGGVWATHGELLLHTTEAMVAIENAANAALVVGTILPTP